MIAQMSQTSTAPQPSAVDALAVGISAVADHGAIVALIVLIDTLVHRRSLRCAVGLLAAIGVPVSVLNTMIKRLVDRERPASAVERDSAVLRRPSSSSFPSGHTLAVASAAVALPTTAVGQVVALTGASAVGWSRLRVGAHHRGDVAGGMVIGVTLGLALRRLTQWLIRRCGDPR